MAASTAGYLSNGSTWRSYDSESDDRDVQEKFDALRGFTSDSMETQRPVLIHTNMGSVQRTISAVDGGGTAATHRAGDSLIRIREEDALSANSYSAEYIHTTGDPHFAEGIVVNVTEKGGGGSARGGGGGSGAMYFAQRGPTEETYNSRSHSSGSNYQQSQRSAASHIPLYKPCRISFKVENLYREQLPVAPPPVVPLQQHYSQSAVNTGAISAIPEESSADAGGACFMEGIMLYHENIPNIKSKATMTKVDGAVGGMSTSSWQPEIREEVQEKSYAGQQAEAPTTSSWQDAGTGGTKEEHMSWVTHPDGRVQYYAGEMPPSVPALGEASAGAAAASSYAWQGEASKPIVEQEWQIIKEWTLNEKGERVETQTKMMKNAQGEWVRVDPATGGILEAVETKTATRSGEWYQGEEWITKADGNREKLEYEWLTDEDSPDGGWIKRNRHSKEILQRSSTRPDFSQMTVFDSKSTTFASTPPNITGEYWVSKGGKWERIPYKWVEESPGKWKKIDSNTGKALSGPTEDWRYGSAWELNSRAVPKKVRYAWQKDGDGKWRMVARKTGRPIDTTWQEGVETVHSTENGLSTMKQVPYRWARDGKKNWVKLNRDSGEILTRSKKGRPLDVVHTETTYIVPSDGERILKRSTTRQFDKGRMISEDAKTDAVDSTEALSVVQDVRSRNTLDPKKLSTDFVDTAKDSLPAFSTPLY